MRKISWVMGLCIFAGNSLAGQIPVMVPFAEGEQLTLSLSRINFNRVFVEGEKIVQVSFPQGAFDVDKSELASSDSKEGSVYLKPVFDTALTVFFATDAGHHFSATVKPEDSFGKTIRLFSKHQTTLDYVKVPVSEVSAVEESMQSMMAGEVPRDFKSERVIPRPFYIKISLKLNVEKHYRGENLSGYVYRIENKSNREITLATSLFANNQAESLSLSTDKLAPKQVAYLYGIYRNQG